MKKFSISKEAKTVDAMRVAVKKAEKKAKSELTNLNK